ncbi:PAS domain S-box protein [uncultured Methanoregula sp.]|uniref:PAS domain S-box protein n=1 Tax=uncultured Methanoregula sp. TaxID=1005933 RepID=UPI002AAB1693|nr:PAS domain S-box protein [uncultured Methanoregula sp.]
MESDYGSKPQEPDSSPDRALKKSETNHLFSVLYVDDEPSLLMPTKIYLEKHGNFLVDTTTTVDDALNKLKNFSYDVIISDYQMPVSDGIQFLKTLRKTGNQIPFIIFTGKGDEEVVIEAYAAGADFYLAKGVNPRAMYVDLTNKIEQIVNRRRVESALRESEELFRTLFNNANDSIFVHEMSPEGFPGRYIMANDIACTHLGYTREELLRMSFQDIIAPPYVDKIPALSRTIQKRGHATFDTVYKKKNGTEYPVEVNAHLFELHGKQLSLSIARDITERKYMEDEIRASEQRLHAIIDGSSIPQFVINRNHEVIYWNKALESYSGIESHEIRFTKNAWKAFYKSLRPLLADLLVDEKLEDIPVWYEGKYRRSRYVDGAFEFTDFFPHFGRNGTWLHGTAVAIRDDRGTIVGALETLEDITDRKNAENELVSSEKYLKTIFNSVQTGLVITDPETNTIIDANPAAVRMIGKNKSDILGSVCNAFLCHTDPKYPVAGIGKNTDFSECVLINPDGRKIPILKTAIPVIISGKSLLLESFLDITDRKRAEDAMQTAYAELEQKVRERTRELFELNRNLQIEANERKKIMEELKVSEEKYRSLVEQTNDIVFQIDKNGRITYISPNVSSILGHSPEESVGRSPAEFMPKDSENFFYLLHEENIRVRQPVSGLELTFLDRGQVPHIFEINGTPHFSQEGVFLGFSGIARDITDRKTLQDELVTSLKEKEILLKEIHHRVKNNMQVISSLLNLQAKLIKDVNSREVIRESQNRVMSIALVHEKLYQSKNLAEIDYSDYLKKIAEYLLQSYGISPKTVAIRIHAENILLPIDKAIPLSLMINEMISNSLKYAFPDNRTGIICVDLRKEEDRYTLVVNDDGIGLPETVTLEQTDTLGMQLVNSLVRQIQGSISLNRVSGTEYRITFTIEPILSGDHYE